MSNQPLSATDFIAPAVTTGGGVAAATASLTVIQMVGLAASIVGIVWGTINIIRALYYFAIWINKTARPWLESRKN